MQTSHTTASAAATTPLARRIVAASWKPVLFAVLMWLSAAAVATYLAAGAVGLPVFAGGTSTLALVGPSAGFLFGFLPGVVVIALLRGKSDTSSFAAAARTAGRYLLAALVGDAIKAVVASLAAAGLSKLGR